MDSQERSHECCRQAKHANNTSRAAVSTTSSREMEGEDASRQRARTRRQDFGHFAHVTALRRVFQHYSAHKLRHVLTQRLALDRRSAGGHQRCVGRAAAATANSGQ